MRVLNSHSLVAGLLGCALCLTAVPLQAEDAPAPDPMAGPAAGGPEQPAPEAPPVDDKAPKPVEPKDGKVKKHGKKAGENPGQDGAGVGNPVPGHAGAGAAEAAPPPPPPPPGAGAEGPAGPAEPAGPGGPGGRGRQNGRIGLGLPPQVRDLLSHLTVLDQANLELANIHQSKGEAENAAAALKAIYDQKDNEACGAAHLLEALWLLQQNKNDEAEAHLIQVTGPFAPAAARELTRMRRDDAAKMQLDFDALIQALTGDKNLAFKGMVIEIAIQEARQANQPDLLVATLKKVSTWTNPEEALKMRAAMEAQLVADYERQQRLQEQRGGRQAAQAGDLFGADMPGGPGAGGPPGQRRRPGAEGGAPAAGQGAGNAAAGQAAAGPDKEKIANLLQQRAEKLRGEGDAERAQRLEQMADRLKKGEITPEELKQKMQERGGGAPPMGGPGELNPPGAKGKGQGQGQGQGQGKAGKHGGGAAGPGEPEPEGRPQPADEAAF